MNGWHYNQRLGRLKKFFQRHSLPLLLGVIATIVVLTMWQHLLKYEQLHTHQLVQQEATKIQAELNQELSTRILTLQQMASRWQFNGGTPKAAWEADAAEYIQDFNGYQAIEWIDPSFHIRWVVPLEGNELVQNLDLNQESRRQVTLGVARDLHQTLLTRTITLVQGGKGMLAAVPLFVKEHSSSLTVDSPAEALRERFDGFIVGVFRFQSLFDSILTTSPQYEVQIFDHNGLIYSQVTRSTVEQPGTGVVQAYGADWQVQVFPTSELVRAGRSLLPEVVLWGGLAIVWTLAFTISLKQRATRQVQQIRKINRQLQDEVIHRQQIEVSLRESEERWQLALRGNNDGIWDWNVKTNEVFFSTRWKEMLGFEEGEILNHLEEWSSRVHPKDLAWVTEVLTDHFSKKTSFYIAEHRVQCKDGSYKWILARGQALWDEAGNVVRMVGSHTDTTERKQAEIALQASEARYQQLVSHMNAGFVVHSPDTHIMQCNTAACELLGLSMDQILGKVAIDPMWHFVREDGTLMPVEEFPVHLVLSTQLPLDGYVLGVDRGDQSRVWVLVTAFPEFDANQQIKQVVVTFIDISQLKQVERNLRETTAAMENAISGIARLDPQGRYLYANKVYAEMAGYQPEEMVGVAWQQTVHSDDLKFMEHVYQQMLQDGKVEVEAKGVRKDGSIFYKQLVMIASYSEQQQFVGHYCFVKDISDRKRSEAKREQAEEALRQSEEKFRQLTENIRAVFWMADLSMGQVLYVSPAYEEIWGRSCEALYQDFYQWIDAVHPEDRDRIEQAQNHDVLEGTYNEEYRIIQPDGSIRWIHDRSFLIKNQSPTTKRIAGIAEDITARKKSEQALRESEEKFRQLIDNIRQVFFILSAEGEMLYISPAYERIWQQSCESLYADPCSWLASIYEEDLPRVAGALHKQISRGQSFDEIYRIIRQDGEIRWISAQSFPLKDEAGQVIRFTGIAEDITQQKQAEDALRQSEATKQAIIQAIPDLLMRMHADGNQVEFISNSDFNLINPKQLSQGIHISDVLPNSLAQLRIHYIQQALQSKKTQVYEQDIVIQGTQRFEEVRIVPLQLDEVLVMVRDITHRKQAEIALQESAAREQAIAEVLQQMRQTLSLETIFAATTQELRRVLNCDRVLIYRFNSDWSGAVVAESVGSGWISVIETLIHQDATFGSYTVKGDRCIIKRWDSREAETRDTYIQKTQGSIYYQGTQHITVTDIYQSGFEDCYIEFLEKFQARACLIVPIFSNNKLWGLLASYQNAEPRKWRESEVQVSSQIVTQLGIAIHQAELFAQVQRQSKELRQAMEAAEAANLAKSMFLANMSHELRTPLNVILGFAQVMAHDSSLTPAHLEDLQTIRRSGDHLLRLINDVLDLSKIEAGHSTLEEAGFDLISLLHTLRTMMAERAKVKQLHLTFEIAPEVPQFVIADEQKLRQVLLNLLSNAIKFTQQGQVKLAVSSVCHSPNDQEQMTNDQNSITLQFEVMDTGVGIAPTEQAIIFDAFMQAEAGRKSAGGTGLGLTITRKLLELMNGSISVESTPEVGSTFTVRVPVCPTSGVDGQTTQQERTVIGLVPGQPHRRILVVDDQRENRTLIVRLLTRLGLDVQEATNGQEAIALWQQWKPHFIWMDIRMPGLDGYEATKQIRAMEQEQASIIIALTAQASQSDRSLALAAGCNDYMSKPFREETLFLKLKEYLGLEYLYAEASDLLNSSSIATLDANTNSLNSFDPQTLTQIPADWLESLEGLALCGNDRAILDLTNQLAPEFDNFRMQLLELVNRFEFEKIVHLIHRDSSS